MLDVVTVCLPGGFDRWYLLTRYHVAEMAAVQARTRRLEIIVTSICHVSRMSRGPGLLRCGEGTDGKTTLYSACSRSPPLLWPIILSNNLNNAPSCSDNLLTSLKQYYDVVSNMEELFSSLKYYCIFLRLKTVLWFETYETCSTATEWRIHDKIYIFVF